MRVSSSGVWATLLVLVVAGVCIRLGFWQLDRLEQRRALNAVVERAMAIPAAALDPVLLDSIARDPTAFVYRAVTVTGSYQLSGEVLLRGRSFRGAPGVHLVAPFRLAGDSSLILVNRGWLPSPDGATADPRPYRDASPLTLLGTLHLVPEAGTGAVHALVVLPDTQIDSFRRLDREVLSRSLDAALPPVYLQVAPVEGPTEPPIAVPLPELDEGPHLGYAMQWFGFAGVALIGFGITLHMRRRKPPE